MEEQGNENRRDAGESRRDLLKQLAKSAYIAPATLALLASSKAAASP